MVYSLRNFKDNYSNYYLDLSHGFNYIIYKLYEERNVLKSRNKRL